MKNFARVASPAVRKKKQGGKNMLHKRIFFSVRRIMIATVIGLVLSALAAVLPVHAADYPQKGKAIQMIVPVTAGGSTDVGARILASGLEKELGAPIMVVNKPGANFQVGLTALAQSRPDGYTIGWTNFPSGITNYLEPERKAIYTRKSFEPIALHVSDPNVFAVKSTSPYVTLKDLVAAAKAKPKGITISSGILNDDQIAILQFQKKAGVQFSQVTFAQGTAPAVTALLGGKIDVFCGNVGDLLAQFKSGEVRILGIMDNMRSPFYPGVKTFEEQGYRVYNASMRGFSAPAGTPKEIVDILSKAAKKVTESEEHKKKMADMGLTIKYMDAAAYSAYWEEYETIIKELIPLSKE
jgi:tripartite-type tricarboxylate transporter receptor subunit TctC